MSMFMRSVLVSVRARASRLAMSTFAVVLGVGFVTGALMFSTMMSGALDAMVAGNVPDVSVQAVGQGTTSGGIAGTAPAQVPAAGASSAQGSADASNAESSLVRPETVQAIRGVKGVARAEGMLMAADAYLARQDGTVATPAGTSALARTWSTAEVLRGRPGWSVTQGREPRSAGECAIDQRTAEAGGWSVGSTLAMRRPGRTPVTLTVVGIAALADSEAGTGTMVLLSTVGAQQHLVGGKNLFHSVWVVAASGTRADQLASAVAAATPKGFEAVSGEVTLAKTKEKADQSLTFITWFLLGFAAVSLMICVFLVLNTFSMVVASRVRELALWRVLGTSKKQVRRLVLLEAAAVGVVGSTAGLVCGALIAVGIRQVFDAVAGGMPAGSLAVTPIIVLAAYAVGVTLTVVAALVPARRAGNVAPVVVLGGGQESVAVDSRRRAYVGGALSALAVGSMGLGMVGTSAGRVGWVGLGAVLLAVGVAVATPALAPRVVQQLGGVLSRRCGAVGMLAQSNASRNPRRTAATASGLMVAVMVVTCMMIIGASATHSATERMRAGVAADVIAVAVSGTPMGQDAVSRIKAVSGVGSVAGALTLSAGVNGKVTSVTRQAKEEVGAVYTQRFTSGSPGGWGPNDAIVDAATAKEKGWTVGSKLTIQRSGATTTCTVTGVFAVVEESGLRGVVIPPPAAEALRFPVGFSQLGARVSEPSQAVRVAAEVRRSLAAGGAVTVTDRAGLVERASKTVGQAISVIYALLVMAMVIALLGVMNTMTLSVVERIGEMALLRAVGLSQGQVRRMVVLEAGAMAAVGALLGVGLGVVCGIALYSAQNEEARRGLMIPWPGVLAMVVALLAGAVVAAWWPARRASKVDLAHALARS